MDSQAKKTLDTMKIITVVGARPQFIKAAVVSRSLREQKSFHETIIHTGQHYHANMSNIFFDELDIPQPDYNLNIGGGTHGQNTGRMIEAIETVLIKEKPDGLLVYGDTDSTLAAVLAAVKIYIPIMHVEAGLRSFNKLMPEEINRILTDHASDLLFAPTNAAVRNLANEGIVGEKVVNIGDVMFDAAIFYSKKANNSSDVLTKQQLTPKSYVLATIHRQENTDDFNKLSNIISGFSKSDLPIIMPIHPRTRKRLDEFHIEIPGLLNLIEPLGYLDMVMLEMNAALIVTDSGGVQKEAYFHKIPCVTLREETEWVELVDSGWNRLVGDNPKLIEAALNTIQPAVTKWIPFYGDGCASNLIATTILTKFS
jgi:UDP-GlcNAc3NAcA epimerase